MEKIYKVKIANMELSLYSSETQEYTEMIAREVDERISHITGDNLSISLVTASLLAAMEMCNELNKLKTGTDNMRTQIKSYMDETNKALAERDEARRLSEKFKNDLLALKIDITNQKNNK